MIVMEAHYERNERKLLAMLGMWVSEMTPTAVFRGFELLGLAADEQTMVGEQPHIIINVEDVL
jgi:hypothetical protein